MMGFGFLITLVVLGLPVIGLIVLAIWLFANGQRGGAMLHSNPPARQEQIQRVTAPRVCSHCGANLQDDWTYCPQCGAVA